MAKKIIIELSKPDKGDGQYDVCALISVDNDFKAGGLYEWDKLIPMIKSYSERLTDVETPEIIELNGVKYKKIKPEL